MLKEEVIEKISSLKKKYQEEIKEGVYSLIKKEISYPLCSSIAPEKESINLLTKEIWSLFYKEPLPIRGDKLFSLFSPLNEEEIKRISLDLNIEERVLFFLGREINRAFWQLIAEKIEIKRWREKYCPLCGNTPEMGIINPEGKRSAVCKICLFAWPTKRIGCLFCDNNQGLRFFYAEDKSPYRADLCPRCKRYIKIVDQRNYKKAPFPCKEEEERRISFLDPLMQEKIRDA